MSMNAKNTYYIYTYAYYRYNLYLNLSFEACFYLEKKKEKYFEYAIQYLYLKKGKLKLANSHLFNFLNFSVFVNPKQPLQESSRFCTPWYM